MKKLLLLALSSVFAFAININTATKAQLMEIQGIGEKKASAIMDYRKLHKDMKIDELKNIEGISDVLIKNISEDIKAEKKEEAKKTK